ncbi:MAG: hypothetical protein EOO85_30930 [Pedobacter sp.]|nr:MAG: hypothetical protein EOO85_30930 [Pedobacter sp.]
MEDFSFRPANFRLYITIFSVVFAIVLSVIVNFIAVNLKYPFLLEWGLYAFFLLFFYEGMAKLLKPISISYIGGIFRAGYLISHCEFSLSDIESYSTINYPTNYGIKNGVILYLKGNRVVEISEVLIDGDISRLITVLDKQTIPRHRDYDLTLWMSRFPRRHRTI